MSGSNRNLYFAFGSNMSVVQMRRRCPEAAMIGHGYLPQHDLVFNRYGSYRPGGVASIVSSNDSASCVYGVIWRMSSTDLKRLDEIENREAYERIHIEVHTLDSGVCICHTYRAFPQARHIPPDPEYLKLIIDAAEAAPFPPEYVKRITALGEMRDVTAD